tara:strand:- start:233 stop:448 length:216 start_codon:yes stop_codon:yes gene_type:complete
MFGEILSNNQFTNEGFMLDPNVGTWNVIDEAPWKARGAAAIFTIGNYSYLAGGRNYSSHFSDFWRFDLTAY